MISHYDTIFKLIMNDPRSRFVSLLTGMEQGKSLSNDAGWYTARTVDYISRISETNFVHIEIQTNVDKTMHWRMANYFTLLNHKLHRWEDDNVHISQFLVYIGADSNSMLKTHPKFGFPYQYKTIELSKCKVGQLATSSFYGDRILGLLMADVTQGDWQNTFDEICTLRSEPHKLEALFFILHLSALRGMQEMIEDAILEMGMYEALKSTPLTARASEENSIGTIIELLSDFFVEAGHHPLNDEECDVLRGLDLPRVKNVYKAITRTGARRSAIFAATMIEQEKNSDRENKNGM
ncbi:hypothetical protein IB277_14825 [Ensifer sp. ENS07]|uniref:hypothetical protein n=1 Tax=unclassified Ensifer TaxID=2633371 RepID=UPI001782A72E|nr:MULTISPECIES: hypothetical protein [unclassified Ensifer]MBD9507925.1 hypothetical protein [Ensifer sp. ENS10]MBD9637578.1 hypothetical protein [Ensifer sp. ENS07]